MPAPRGAGAKAAIVGVCVGLGAVACGPSVGDGTGGGSEGTVGADGTSATTEGMPMSGPATTTPGTTSPATSGSTGDDVMMTTLDPSADESTSDAPDDGPGGFYAVPPDGGMPVLECDVFSQDCPVGEKCMPWANDGGTDFNALRCSPVSGTPGAIDEACTVEGSPVSGVDDCALGLLCVTDDEATLTGQCEALCDTDDGDAGCALGETCTALEPGSLVLPNLGICTA